MRRVSIFLTGALAAAALAAPSHASPAAVQAAIGDPSVISDVAENVVDSVVNVSTTRQVDVDEMDDPFALGAPADRTQSALGSGVIVGERGRILTNAHVIDGADTIEVHLADGNAYAAKVVGVDKHADLAVLQLQGDVPKLKPLAFGDSSKLRLGEVVLAVGDPFGVGNTVTMGIVSAKGRYAGIEDYEDFIQTDAAINPGNSGGALVNLHGELIGINTAILSRSGGYQGVGFAIPTDMAKPIMDALVKDGHVSHGWLGIAMADLSRDAAAQRKLAAIHGVLVADVQRGGPAAKAGVRADDVIVAIDGQPIVDGHHLRNVIAMKAAGTAVRLGVLRGGRAETLDARLGELPEPTRH